MNADLIRRLRMYHSDLAPQEAADALEAAEARIADVEQANRDCVEHFDQMRGRAEVAEAEVELLRESLELLVDAYVRKADVYDPEREPVVKASRAALHAARRDAAEQKAPPE